MQDIKNTQNSAVIIGGGISGAVTAYSLAKRGYNVTLYEKNSTLASEGSGNYQALLYGTFHGNYTPLTELHFMGLHYSIQLLKTLLQENIDYQQSGLVQLFDDKTLLDKTFNAIRHNYETFKNNNSPLSKAFFKDFCHIITADKLPEGCNAKYALFFPQNLWLHPQNLITKLVDHPNIRIILNTAIDEFNLIEDTLEWQLKNSGKTLAKTKNLILCNANAANQFIYTQNINLLATRGQTTAIKAENKLPYPICKNSYILPSSNGYFTIGATFKPHTASSVLNHLEHTENLNAVAAFYPNIQYINVGIPSGHAAIRCSVKDYLPVVGPLAQYDKFMSVYAKLVLDKNLKVTEQCPFLPGLYLNIAHGSKGFITAPLAGEIIANYVSNNTQFTLSEKTLKAISPNRLYLNKIIKSTAR